MDGIATLCADFGGSRVKLAVVSGGRVVALEMFDRCECTADTLAAVAEKGREMMRNEGDAFAGLAVAAPGIVDEEKRRVVICNGKYAGLEDIDLVAWARREFSLEVRVVNDARAALLGELSYGCARGETDAVMVILGTGVGTAAISEGRIVRGRHFVHGLLGGHLPINFDGDRRCTCGACNCLEAYVGSWALKQLARDPSYDYQRLRTDYEAGDEKAKELFALVARALGAGTVALVHAFDPETVIWSGGVSHFSALIVEAQRYVLENSWTPWGTIRFLQSNNPESSVILGLHALFANEKQ